MNLNKLTSVALFLLSLSSASIMAGEVTVSGTGKISVDPDYYSVEVLVTSQCFDSASDARQASAVLANSLRDVFQKQMALILAKDRIPEDSKAIGGGTVRLEFTYDRNRSEPICNSKWQSTIRLQFKVRSANATTDLVQTLIEVSDEAKKSKPVLEHASDLKEETSAKTFAEVYAPQPQLLPATLAGLRRALTADAVRDAQSKIDSLTDACGLVGIFLKSVSESYSNFTELKSAGARSMAMGDSASTPLDTGKFEVSASYNFVYIFESSGIICRPFDGGENEAAPGDNDKPGFNPYDD